MEYKFEQFNSIHEFIEAIEKRPNSKTMLGLNADKDPDVDYKFSGTFSYKQALELLMNGDTKLAEKLNCGLKLKMNNTAKNTKNKMEYSVAGYQASVPRYLQGIPTSMVNSKRVPNKEKVIHFVKLVNYNGGISKETMEREGIKALELVTKAEQLGYRVNVDVMFCMYGDYQNISMLLNVKKSSERLNVSKAAFVIAHPSFFRRLGLKWIETYPELTDYSYRFGYGCSIYDESEIKQALENSGKNPSKYYIIPQFVSNVDTLIKSWNL